MIRTLYILIVCSFYLGAMSIDMTGHIVSDNEKILTSRYMGFVSQINVSEGDVVKKGDLIYVIDSEDLDNKKLQAKFNLQRYQNEYNNISLNVARYQRLYKKDIVSLYELENLELGQKNLQTMINIASLQLEEIHNQYKYLKITAPNDGVIIAKNIKVGEMAMPGIPAVVISDLSDLKILTEVNEKNLKYIKKGKLVSVEIPSLSLETKGEIYSVIKSSNPMSHTFKLKITFDSKGYDIYPGMYSKIILNILGNL